MEHERRSCPPAELSSWIALQEGAAASEADACHNAVAHRLEALAQRLAIGVARPHEADKGRWLEPYIHRLWNCCWCHWQRLAVAGPLGFEKLVGRLEAGELGYETRNANILREVTLAQALELREAKAAEMFEREYMPVVRGVARRVGGAAAVDAVDNFAAELILPRGERPPRIASFQGRTSLAGWLRAVVTNFWISRARQRQPLNLTSLPESPRYDPEAAGHLDGRPCEELLRPMFAEAVAVLETDQRVLLKMLLLDGVGQNELSRSLGVSSGTLTRRRQRAVERVWERVRELSERNANPRQVASCLKLVLAGDDPALGQRLGEVLAASVRGWGAIEAAAHGAGPIDAGGAQHA